jgi:DNA-binding MurR/RpiR family transcriptional regulator
VSRYAKYVLPCSVDVEGAWDSSVSLFAIVEAIIARVTELNWTEAETRIAEKESLDGRLPGE